MKIYFAGSWYRKNELREIRNKVISYDPTLISVSTWLDDPDGPHDRESTRTFAIKQADAMRDSRDVAECDLFILFTSDNPKFQVGGGKFWEFGRAYTLKKGCIVVGPQEQIFENMPFVGHLDNAKELLAAVSAKELPTLAYMYRVWEGSRRGNF